VDLLTINEENRLKREVETLKIKKSELEQMREELNELRQISEDLCQEAIRRDKTLERGKNKAKQRNKEITLTIKWL
jgi:hypothetical protein